MAILVKGHTFANGDQITSAKLNNLVDLATFAAGSVDDATITLHASGYMQVGTIQTGNIAAASITTAKIADSTGASDGVTAAKLASGCVTTAKISDSNVTTAKIADSNVTTAKIADANITAPKLSGAQTGTAPIYGARAWVMFDATRNAAGGSDTANTSRYLYGSGGNVASVVKTGTGIFTVTMTAAMPDANYAVICNGGDAASPRFMGVDPATQTTTTFTVYTDNGSLNQDNFAINSLVVFR